MSDDEFHFLTQELFAGLPVTIVLSRLVLALRAVVEAGGEPSADALRSFCALRAERDREDYFSEDRL